MTTELMPLPPPLVPPGPVGIIAPASAPRSMEKLAVGIAALRQRGFEVIHDPPSAPPRGYLAAPDADRIAELNRMLRRTDVSTLICARGGFGVMRLLDHVDYEAARDHPKLLVGYSDITALQLALYRHSGWKSLSGPMVSVEWADHDPLSEGLFTVLASGGMPSPLLNPDGSGLVPGPSGTARNASTAGGAAGDTWTTGGPAGDTGATGTVEGTLLGGNLSMIVRLLGTPHLPDLKGAILFLEDVGEPPYRLDALLAQLRMTGVLANLGGVVLGGFTEAEVPEGRPSLTVNEVLHDYFADAPFPVASGLAYGHFPVKVTMPIGVTARLEVTPDSATLRVLESVVAS